MFYRVYEKAGVAQTALVLLNKGDAAQTIDVRDWLEPGEWRDAFGGANQTVADHLAVAVPAHGVRIYFHDQPLTRADARARLATLMKDKGA